MELEVVARKEEMKLETVVRKEEMKLEVVVRKKEMKLEVVRKEEVDVYVDVFLSWVFCGGGKGT